MNGRKQCLVWLFPEETGFSAIVPLLPGVASQGDTKEKAIVNVAEALVSSLEVYRSSGVPVPWVRSLSVPEDGFEEHFIPMPDGFEAPRWMEC